MDGGPLEDPRRATVMLFWRKTAVPMSRGRRAGRTERDEDGDEIDGRARTRFTRSRRRRGRSRDDGDHCGWDRLRRRFDGGARVARARRASVTDASVRPSLFLLPGNRGVRSAADQASLSPSLSVFLSLSLPTVPLRDAPFRLR